MKQLNITFDDKEHKLIETIKEKSGMTWHDYLIHIISTSEKSTQKSEESSQ